MSLILDRSSIVQVPGSAPHLDTDWRRGRLHRDPESQARHVWFGVAGAINVLIASLAGAMGPVGDHAVAASLVVLFI